LKYKTLHFLYFQRVTPVVVTMNTSDKVLNCLAGGEKRS